jgi:hypothetical protein
LALAGPLQCEAPENLTAWRAQQRRWSHGFVQVAAKMLPRIWASALPLGRKTAATLLVGLQAAFPCFVIAAGAFLADIILRGEFTAGHAALLTGTASIAVCAAVAVTWPAFRGLRRGGMIRYATTLASLPPLLIYLAAANSASILSAPFRGGGEFVRTPKSGS